MMISQRHPSHVKFFAAPRARPTKTINSVNMGSGDGRGGFRV